MENKVFAILKKVSKPEITGKMQLSALSDLEQSLDVNSPDNMNFEEVENSIGVAENFLEIVDEFVSEKANFKNKYNYIKNNYGDLEVGIQEMKDYLDTYVLAAEELGLRASDLPMVSEATILIRDTQQLKSNVDAFLTQYEYLYEIAETGIN